MKQPTPNQQYTQFFNEGVLPILSQTELAMKEHINQCVDLFSTSNEDTVARFIEWYGGKPVIVVESSTSEIVDISYFQLHQQREIIYQLVTNMEEFEVENPKIINPLTRHQRLFISARMSGTTTITKLINSQPKTLKDLILQNLFYPDKLVNEVLPIIKTTLKIK